MVQRREVMHPSQVVVIGAGIAGAQVARALAERHMDVTVIDPDLPRVGQDPARRGALYVKPAIEYSPETGWPQMLASCRRCDEIVGPV